MHGDFTTIGENDYGTIDLLVGGTPCQSFSVAGLRKGLDDERGNLALEFCRLLDRKKPRWFVWENVPGVLSSNGGRDFGAFLGAVAECGYGFAYRVLDAQYFGLAQRRERVFVVGYSGDWRPPAAVFLESSCLRGNPAPSRKKREDVAAYTSSSIGGYGEGCGTLRANGGDIGGGSETLAAQAVQTFDRQSSGEYGVAPVASTVSERDYKRASDLVCHIDGGDLAKTQTFATPINSQVAMRHKALGERTGLGIGNEGDPAYTLQAAHHHAVLTTTHDVAGTMLSRSSSGGFSNSIDHAAAGYMVVSKHCVRRLTPKECERLQGLPDDKTLIPKSSDSARYKAIGNSMAVPVMRWIGERIDLVDKRLL